MATCNIYIAAESAADCVTQCENYIAELHKSIARHWRISVSSPTVREVDSTGYRLYSIIRCVTDYRGSRVCDSHAIWYKVEENDEKSTSVSCQSRNSKKQSS